jgi:hypothetical protein
MPSLKHLHSDRHLTVHNQAELLFTKMSWSGWILFPMHLILT